VSFSWLSWLVLPFAVHVIEELVDSLLIPNTRESGLVGVIVTDAGVPDTMTLMALAADDWSQCAPLQVKISANMPPPVAKPV
jgi:hypothetical protein